MQAQAADRDKKFKILYVIDRLTVGGAERVLITLANLFHERGHQVGVLLINKGGALVSELSPGIEVFQLDRKFRLDPFKMLRFSRIASKFDFVHVHMRYNLKYAGLVRLIFPFKSRIIFHDHWGDIKFDRTLPASLKYFLSKYPYIGVSREHTDWALSVAHLRPDKIFLLRNIILRKDHPLNGKTHEAGYRLLLVSNFRRTKNMEFAIELMAYLNRNAKGRSYKLDIAGAINDEDYFAEIKEKIRQAGLENSISIINDCTEIQPILHRYDLAIHTATSESGPLVLIEYLSQGLPFVTYNTGEVVEQVSDVYPEFILHSFDLREWGVKVEEILGYPRSHYAQRLTDTYNRLFSAESYFRSCLNIYEAIKQDDPF